jgi:SAM-dependent methyltransferase
MRDYYDARAPEYDEWYVGTGLFAGQERPEWDGAVRALRAALDGLPPARTLDVACGTGFLTRHLPGEVTGLDQSPRMLDRARAQTPGAEFVRGDALELRFPDKSFERLFTGHFYGHLEIEERHAFLVEAARVAPELIVADSAVRPDRPREQWQERRLNDGSRFEVYKRYFDGDELAEELGGGEVLHQSRWFVLVRVADQRLVAR